MPLGTDQLARLTEWLVEHLGAHPGSGVELQLVEGGRSNLTFFMRCGERDWVLRRPPLGPLLPTAHSMRREFDVLRALQSTLVPVPRALQICEDAGVLGAPFYVMERLHGTVIRLPKDCHLTPAEAQRCSLAIVRTLATLHQVPFAEVGLARFGKPGAFMERQLHRWHEQLANSRIRPLPDLDELGRRLAARVPEQTRVAVVHGDYRIDNLMLDTHDPGRVTGVLDWEMATVGDPLADLGMLLMYWGEPGEVFAAPVQAVTAEPGFIDRGEVVAEYGRCTSFDLEHLHFYVAFAHFKLAVIVEGIHARVAAGNTVGGGFEAIETIPAVLAARGLELFA